MVTTATVTLHVTLYTLAAVTLCNTVKLVKLVCLQLNTVKLVCLPAIPCNPTHPLTVQAHHGTMEVATHR